MLVKRNMYTTLNDQQTKEQFEDFAVVTTEGRRGNFYPVVPSSCINDLYKTLRELGLDSKSNVHVLKHN